MGHWLRYVHVMFRFQDIAPFVLTAFVGTTTACSTPPVPADPTPTGSKPVASASAAPKFVDVSPPPVVSIAKPEAPAPLAPKPLAVSKSVAHDILDALAASADSCPSNDDQAAIRCWIGKRYEAEPSAQALALSLFDEAGYVAGVEREYFMDGGFRGTIHLVPEWPIRQYKKHLEWVVASARDFNHFFEQLATKSTKPIQWRHRAIAFKFMRSVGKRTPSAYASDWSIGYNVSGSLHGSVDAVRETLFHEIFHLNDPGHSTSSGGWSAQTLRKIHDGILARCGTKIACLTPYAPMPTMVRGGTYYAFQPNNGDAVHEYGAELATRYYREHRAILRGEKLPSKPFKCGPPENAEAWKLLVEEFFAGIDLIPAC
jgi:hypothetical protein